MSLTYHLQKGNLMTVLKSYKSKGFDNIYHDERLYYNKKKIQACVVKYFYCSLITGDFPESRILSFLYSKRGEVNDF